MTTEKKIIIVGTIVTILILGGTILLLSKNESLNVPEDQIITRKGLHWHPKLSIIINGEKQELADGIGLGAVHEKMHTHTEDFKEGVVHMEMEGLVTKDDTKLGKFFQVWRKDFNSRKILDREATSAGIIKMAVNGTENEDFESYLMRDGDNIEIKYGQL